MIRLNRSTVREDAPRHGGLEITEVRVSITGANGDVKAWHDPRCRGYASVSFNESFAVHDVRIVELEDRLTLAMPDYHVSDRCHACHTKNHLKANYCNHCGERLADGRMPPKLDRKGRPRFRVDVAHPLTSEFRNHLEIVVIEAYHDAATRAETA